MVFSRPDSKSPVNDPSRLKKLYDSKLLETGHDDVLDDVTRSICKDLGVPISLISIVEQNRQFFKSEQGLPQDISDQRQTDIDYSICRYVVEKGDMIVIPDASADTYFKNHPSVVEWGVTAYLGVPLMYQGQIMGSVCAVDYAPRAWTEKDIEIIRLEAEKTASYLIGNTASDKPPHD